jgi:hypothetical protein
MNLESFIIESLKSVRVAVTKTNEELMDTNKYGQNKLYNLGTVQRDYIEFDVAVTAENSDAEKVGGGLSVVGINLGGDTKVESKQSNISRIKFRIYLNTNFV